MNKIENREYFLRRLKANNKNLDIKYLGKIFDFCRKAHHDQKRKSGEDFFIHPLNVALILSSMNMDCETVAAGLLHDVIEDTNIDYAEIKHKFGEKIANLVKGLTKLETYHYTHKKRRKVVQAENFRKLLIAITQDVRVILIKLADRLHNIRTLKFLQPAKRKKIARETLDIYAPIANRFGLAKIKNELEDTSFKYLYPEEYNKIKKIVSQRRRDRETYIKDFIPVLKNLIADFGLDCNIQGRSKHFYSIYHKSKVKKIAYEDIYDLAALRVIVDSVDNCYNVLGIIHSQYNPFRKYRDYINRPKPNGYQSLHTVIIGPEKKKVEIQIRTKKMHQIAEEGIAAHWLYKEMKVYTSTSCKEIKQEQIQHKFKNQINWIRNLIKNNDNRNFLEKLKLNLYKEIIIVRTPEDDFIKLPKNASPVDFAFAIHTEVGFRCSGAIVNDKIVPLDYQLFNGDKIKILTTNEINCSYDWLKFMKSKKAKAKVRSYLRRKEREDSIELGKEIFQKKCRKNHLKFDEEEIKQIANKMKISDLPNFYAELGQGKIVFEDILAALEKPVKQIPPKSKKTQKISRPGIKIGKVNNLMINFANCCNPKPGDDVIGYTTRGRGITVHKQNCKNPGFLNLKKTESDRIVPIEWDFTGNLSNLNLTSTLKIRITSNTKRGVLKSALHIFNENKIDINDPKIKKYKGKIVSSIKAKIPDEDTFQELIKKIYKIPGVRNVAW